MENKYIYQSGIAPVIIIIAIFLIIAGAGYYLTNKDNQIKDVEIEQGVNQENGVDIGKTGDIFLDKDALKQEYNFELQDEEYNGIHNYQFKSIPLNECSLSLYKEKYFNYPDNMISSYSEDGFDILIFSEGATGTTYKTINYLFEKDNLCYVFEVVEKISNCGNFYSTKNEVEMCSTIQGNQSDSYKREIKQFLNAFTKGE